MWAVLLAERLAPFARPLQTCRGVTVPRSMVEKARGGNRGKAMHHFHYVYPCLAVHDKRRCKTQRNAPTAGTSVTTSSTYNHQRHFGSVVTFGVRVEKSLHFFFENCITRCRRLEPRQGKVDCLSIVTQGFNFSMRVGAAQI